MKIDVYCNDGSPMGVIPPDIYTRGVGGAELSLMSWAKVAAATFGHDVTIYNNPRVPGYYDGVTYTTCDSFRPDEKRDVYIAFRSPNRHSKNVRAGLKLHWSTDQYTVGDFSTDIFPFVDKVVSISPFHKNYLVNRYGIDPDKVGVIDLGVLVDEYQYKREKRPASFLFSSVPDRGLEKLAAMWGRISNEIPGASLAITSDYTLWGAASSGTHKFRKMFVHHDGVHYYGSVPRYALVDFQMGSEVLAYPCTYDELFCVAVAEAQVAGCVPVTPPTGALETTNQFGILTPPVSSPTFEGAFVEALKEAMAYTPRMRRRMMDDAYERFNWNNIFQKWVYLFENGDFEPAVADG